MATKHWSKGDQISSLIGNYGVVFFPRMSCIFRRHGIIVIFVDLLDPKSLLFLALSNVICLFAPPVLFPFCIFGVFDQAFFPFLVYHLLPIVFVSFSAVLSFFIYFSLKTSLLRYQSFNLCYFLLFFL